MCNLRSLTSNGSNNAQHFIPAHLIESPPKILLHLQLEQTWRQMLTVVSIWTHLCVDFLNTKIMNHATRFLFSAIFWQNQFIYSVTEWKPSVIYTDFIHSKIWIVPKNLEISHVCFFQNKNLLNALPCTTCNMPVNGKTVDLGLKRCDGKRRAFGIQLR